jgi:2-polyprenyl-6-hydroxyphenyl methylase / 3-demethylubiquinone-9 3-methyltransferase
LDEYFIGLKKCIIQKLKMKSITIIIIIISISIIFNIIYNNKIIETLININQINRLKTQKDEIINNEFYDEKEFSNTWDSENGWSQGLHFLNKQRIKYIQQLIPQKDLLILGFNFFLIKLDIGCGGGLISNKLSELGYTNISAIDPSINSIKKGIESDKTKRVMYSQGNIYELMNKYEKKTFDVILLMDVLDHLNDLESAIKVVEYLLKEKGIIIFETVNRNKRSCLMIKYFAEFLGSIPKDTHSCNLFIKPIELIEIFKRFKLNNIEMKGLSFYFNTIKFYNYFFDKFINFNLVQFNFFKFLKFKYSNNFNENMMFLGNVKF